MTIGVEHIQRAVAAYYGLSVDELLSPRRSRQIAHPRQMAMALSRELTPRSFPDLARRFGDMDHTTVMYACKQVRRRVIVDDAAAYDYRILRGGLARARQAWREHAARMAATAGEAGL